MTTSGDLARKAVEFIWDGQTGLAEMCVAPSNRNYFEISEALDDLGSYRYFAPLTRVREGSKKKDISPVGNVLWVDIDRRDAPELTQSGLAPYGVTPSLIIDSGNKGFWMYLKLDHLIPSEQIEQMNRGLASLVLADSSWDMGRIARMPGSVNQGSGRMSTVYELTGSVYDPEDLRFLEELADIRTPALAAPDDMPVLRVDFPQANLPAPLWMYIRDHPEMGIGIDRSNEEQKIFTALEGQGWTDEQIISFADFHRLPRHREELRRHKDYRWTKRSIASARKYIQNNPDLYSKYINTYIDHPMCCESRTYQHVNRRDALKLIQDGVTSGEFVRSMKETFGCARSTVMNILSQLEIGGYITREKIGRFSLISLTEAGHYALSGPYRWMLRYPTIRTRCSEDKRYRGA